MQEIMKRDAKFTIDAKTSVIFCATRSALENDHCEQRISDNACDSAPEKRFSQSSYNDDDYRGNERCARRPYTCIKHSRCEQVICNKRSKRGRWNVPERLLNALGELLPLQ